MYIPTIPGNKKHSIPIRLVVYLPSKKNMSSSDWIIITIGGKKSCSKPPTRYITDY